MAKVTVTKCDGCKKVIDRNSDHYEFNSKRFTDGAGSRDYNTVTLDLCEQCVSSLVATIDKIAERMRGND